ncbi:MAG TPA: CCA tRNA nucleotidyltransferase [Alphaproteobacteria bacterium]|nr:CCA tRNA nucleotidyltransferase [Alphaproteobacteria bacterium]
MSDFPSHLDPQKHSWLQSEALRRLFGVIKAAGGETRAVGGAVRDALLGRPVNEIDLAVNLAPDRVISILEDAKIKVVPTGFEHGTVTAVIDHKGYELTTLRKDVETDGRRARVAFTDDWQGDAARRDFTINALYADEAGKIYDYFSGRTDLAQGRVRFIGDARARIKEDVLRILRFYRFYAYFGKGAPDADGLAACRELATLLPTLSAERVWREIVKLLAVPDPAPTWKTMRDNAALTYVAPDATNIMRLEGLVEAEKRYEEDAVPLARFAALLPKNKMAADSIAQKLKLSNKDADVLRVLTVLPDALRGKLDPVPFRRAMYEHGMSNARAAALLVAAEDRGADLEPALAAAAEWQKPVFPLQGEDILKMGLTPGPQVGVILKSVEDWWAAQDFRPNRDECLAEAKKLIK